MPLTKSSERRPRELHQKLARLGLDVPESHFYTSALATCIFLQTHCPGGGAFVIGEAGLIHAVYDAGLTMNNVRPGLCGVKSRWLLDPHIDCIQVTPVGSDLLCIRGKISRLNNQEVFFSVVAQRHLAGDAVVHADQHITRP